MQLFINREAMAVFAAVLIAQPLAMSARGQASPAVIIDKVFKSDYSMPGMRRDDRSRIDFFKKYMGTYQRTIAQDENNYLAVFDSGTLPIELKIRPSGAIESLNFGCPNTRSLSFYDLPTSLRSELKKCGGFRKAD